MAQWEKHHWESTIESGLPRRERRRGTYATYLPDPLMGRHFPPTPDLDAPELHGIRTKQNWIGGSYYHPLEADFIPPPQRVRSLMDDLCTYLSGATHSPVLQAALVHA